VVPTGGERALLASVAELDGSEHGVVWTTETVGASTAALVGGGVVLALEWDAVDNDLDRARPTGIDPCPSTAIRTVRSPESAADRRG